MTSGDAVYLLCLLFAGVQNWRLQSTVNEQSRLLASRSFTDYGVGLKKEAEAKQIDAAPEAKEADYNF